MRLTCVLAFALIGIVAGASAADVDPGKQVIDQALAALGGDKFLNFHNRLVTGRVYSFYHNEVSGFDRAQIYTEYVAPPPKGDLGIRERQLLGKKKDYSFLYLPDQAWEITFRGARPVEDAIWKRYQRTTENDIFYILKVRHNEPGMIYDYVGSQVYLSRHVEIVDITDAQRRTVRVYFDHNSHLPIRQSFEWRDETIQQRDDEISNYDKFRDIGGGIFWPYTIERTRNGYKVFQVFADSVEANVAPPPHTFDLPPGTKIGVTTPNLKISR